MTLTPRLTSTSGPGESAAPGELTLGLRALGPYLSEHRPALVTVALISLVGAAAALAQPLLVSHVITTVQDGARLGPVVGSLIASCSAGR